MVPTEIGVLSETDFLAVINMFSHVNQSFSSYIQWPSWYTDYKINHRSLQQRKFFLILYNEEMKEVKNDVNKEFKN